MAATFRPPLITKWGWTWPSEAVRAGSISPAWLTLQSTGPVQPPLNKTPIIDPIRYVTSPWAALNSQWYLEASSQQLYLSSKPLSASLIDPVRFLASPWAAILAQVDQSSQLLYLASLPINVPIIDSVRFIASPWAAIYAQANLNPSSQLLYLSSTPLSGILIDRVRFIASEQAARRSQMNIDRSSLELYLASNPAPGNPIIEPVRFWASPWTAILAQSLNQSSQNLYLASLPIINNWPPEVLRGVARQQPLDMSGATPLALIAPPAVVAPMGVQAYDVRIGTNPWPAIAAQYNLTASSKNLFLASTPVTQTTADLPRLNLRQPDLTQPMGQPQALLPVPVAPMGAQSFALPSIPAARDLPAIFGGEPLTLRAPAVVVPLPAGQQAFDLRIQSNPWAALRSQLGIAGTPLPLKKKKLKPGGIPSRGRPPPLQIWPAKDDDDTEAKETPFAKAVKPTLPRIPENRATIKAARRNAIAAEMARRAEMAEMDDEEAAIMLFTR